MTSPTAAFSPLLFNIVMIVPDAGEGSLTVALSVASTTTGSSWRTSSPGFLSHVPISTSVTDSPTEGTTNSQGISVTYYANAAAIKCSCSFLWLLWEPVAGLAEAGRDIPQNGGRPRILSPRCIFKTPA